MAEESKIIDEIVENVSAIPAECQEHILDVVKAMAFTRKVIQKSQLSEGKEDGFDKKESI